MISVPNATYNDDVYVFSWVEEGITATVERFNEEKTDVRVELTIDSAHELRGGQVYFGRLLLLGPTARRDVIKHCLDRDDSVDWQAALEQICTLSMRRYRQGEPAIDLWSAELPNRSKYLVKPFLFDNALNLIYGSGDSGKSLFALAAGLVIATGGEIAGMASESPGPVLYCDWEDSPETHQERLRALARGTGLVPTEGQIIYRRMTASLPEASRDLRKLVATSKAVLVIIDSLGMACGGDPSDAGLIIKTMIAARSLGPCVLGVHHIAKDAKDKTMPYGSSYASNEARSSWYVASERMGTQLSMVMQNHKSNRGARQERQAFRMSFQEDEREILTRVEIVSLNFAQSKAIGDDGQRYQIQSYLLAHGSSTVKEIAEGTDINAQSAARVLRRYMGKLFVQTDSHTWGAMADTKTDTQADSAGSVRPDSSVMADTKADTQADSREVSAQVVMLDNGKEMAAHGADMSRADSSEVSGGVSGVVPFGFAGGRVSGPELKGVRMEDQEIIRSREEVDPLFDDDERINSLQRQGPRDAEPF